MEAERQDPTSPMESRLISVTVEEEKLVPTRKKQPRLVRNQDVQVDEESDDCSEEVAAATTPATNLDFKSLCNPRPLCELLEELSVDQKKAVRDIGFGGLLSMKIHCHRKPPKHLYGWMLEAFNPMNQIVYVYGKPAFHVVSGDVRDLFMLPNNEAKPVLGSNAASERAALRQKLVTEYGMPNNGKYHATKILNQLKRLKDGCDDFKRLFGLYALTSFLAPTTNRAIRIGVLNSLVDVSEIKTYDWCGYVMDCLCSAVQTWKRGESVHIGGCIEILQLSYLQRSLWKGKMMPRELPLVQHYDEKKLAKVINGEFNSGGFGRGIFVLEGLPVSNQDSGRFESIPDEAICHMESDFKTDSAIEMMYPNDLDRTVAKATRDFEMFCRAQLPRLIETKNSTNPMSNATNPLLDRLINGLQALRAAAMDEVRTQSVCSVRPYTEEGCYQPEPMAGMEWVIPDVDVLGGDKVDQNGMEAAEEAVTNGGSEEGCYQPEPMAEMEWVIPDVDVLGGDMVDQNGMEAVKEAVKGLFDEEDRNSEVSEGTAREAERYLEKLVCSIRRDPLYGGGGEPGNSNGVLYGGEEPGASNGVQL